MTRWILLALTVGLLAGHFFKNLPVPSGLEGWLFSVMLFGVGLELGREQTLWTRLRAAGLRVILFPLNTILGTLAGGLCAALVLREPIVQCLAVSAGFGWYSLSAIIVNQLNGPVLAATAFFANLLREMLSFVAVPLLRRHRQDTAAIAAAGATSMDTTLPLFLDADQPELPMFAFVHGAILSSLVPLIIPFLFRVGL